MRSLLMLSLLLATSSAIAAWNQNSSVGSGLTAKAANVSTSCTIRCVPVPVAVSAGPAITAEQVLLYVDVPTEQLVEMGQQVRTERIDTDTARLLGTAYDFALTATPAQRRAVPSLTEQPQPAASTA